MMNLPIIALLPPSSRRSLPIIEKSQYQLQAQQSKTKLKKTTSLPPQKTPKIVGVLKLVTIIPEKYRIFTKPYQIFSERQEQLATQPNYEHIKINHQVH